MEISRDYGTQQVSKMASSCESCQPAPVAPPKSGGGSSLQVSDTARQLNEVAKLVHAASDIRTEKVQAIKQAVDSGEYKVDLDKLADRLTTEI